MFFFPSQIPILKVNHEMCVSSFADSLRMGEKVTALPSMCKKKNLFPFKVPQRLKIEIEPRPFLRLESFSFYVNFRYFLSRKLIFLTRAIV